MILELVRDLHRAGRMALTRATVPGQGAIETILRSEVWGAVVRFLTLSRREAEIIERILRLDDDELSIAAYLQISSHTVHTHLERLYRKLQVSSRSQLVTRIFAAYAAIRDGGPGRLELALRADEGAPE